MTCDRPTLHRLRAFGAPGRAPVVALSLALALGMPAAPVAAQSVYAGVGTTGLTLGVAHAYSDVLGARVEVSALPSVSRTDAQDGIDYGGDVRSRRVAALFDWHPASGLFRVTAGLSAGRTSGDFYGAPATGGSIVIGASSVSFGPDDRYEVKAEFPATMPYLGLGIGHTPASGWGFHADAGLLVGKAKITGALSPSLAAKIAATGRDPQAELQAELATVRDRTDAMIGVPVLSLGVSYRW
jgi:hypothetical protein